MQCEGIQAVPQSIVIKSGTHTAEVLKEHGYDAARVRELFGEGVIGKESSSASDWPSNVSSKL
jgi:crotonobetainyl-CoA:carnitine CoA-transferase CaiB-like acyl-CoA transferase